MLEKWSRVRKGFKCYCGKSYKTSQGLKNHSMVVHNTTSTETLNNNNNNVTRSHSPSSVSSGGNFSSSQSQLSPSGGAKASTTSMSNASPTFTQTVAQSNQITLKAASTANVIAVNSLTNSPNSTHALLSAHNPNKLVKLNSDCFDGVLVGTKASGKNLIITSAANGTNNGNILVSTATAIPNADEQNGNGAKINLPSLVNLGILTPATSPKQHTQLTPQISPNHTIASSANSANNKNNNNNNENSLPLTPISPLNKAFNGTGSVSIGKTTNRNHFQHKSKKHNNSNNNNKNNTKNKNNSHDDDNDHDYDDNDDDDDDDNDHDNDDDDENSSNSNNNQNNSMNNSHNDNNNNNHNASPNLNDNGLHGNIITADASLTEDT